MHVRSDVSIPIAFRPSAPHKARPFLGCGYVERNGWGIKRYAITADGAQPGEELLERALELAIQVLPECDDASRGHGAAIVTAHAGRDGNYVLVDWWVGENMLSRQLFLSRAGDLSFVPFAERSIIACVWELQILAFEGRLWVEHILSRPNHPDFDAYFGTFLDGSL